MLVVFATNQAEAQSLPSGWSLTTIGSPGTGTGSYNNGAFSLSAQTGGFGGAADSFVYVNQPLTGDGTVIARVLADPGYLGGIMIRQSLTPGSPNILLTTSSGQGYGWIVWRTSDGGSSNQASTRLTGMGFYSTYFMKLTRTGQIFRAYVSFDRLTWTQIGSDQTISMSSSVYVGLAVASNALSLDEVSIDSAAAPAPTVSNVSATTGAIGEEIELTGANFGTTQGSSTVLLNGLAMTIDSWSDSLIAVTVPSGAANGWIEVAKAPTMNMSNPMPFEVTSEPLPTGWLDADIGVPGTASAVYAGGAFTLSASINAIGGTGDSLHFVYQPLNGDGSIVARMSNITYNAWNQGGVMMRDSLADGATSVFIGAGSGQYTLIRPSAGSNTSQVNGGFSATYPVWLKLTRAGNTFSFFSSLDGVYWLPIASSQTVNMSSSAYVGLAVGGAAATFDYVSAGSSASVPTITKVSATTGSVGGSITITGAGFGGTQNASVVSLNGTTLTVNSWSATSLNVSIPTGASTGNLAVMVAPSMNASNPIWFQVTPQPLPMPWLDLSVGYPNHVGPMGTSTFSNGAYTITSNALGSGGTSDSMHLVYQTLTGDGTVTARVLPSGPWLPGSGVMMRSSLDPAAMCALVYVAAPPGASYVVWAYRSTANANMSGGNGPSVTPGTPYWTKLTRSGNLFTAYVSPDGIYWTQQFAQSISMPSTIYVGYEDHSGADGGGYGSSSAFDYTSFSSGPPDSTPSITSISPTVAGPNTPITIVGSNFGNSQGSGNVYFNGTPATSITIWTATQIVAKVPIGATSGPLTVVTTLGSNQSPYLAIYNPVISSVTPPAAPIGGTVTLAGTGFGDSQGSGDSVQVGGVTVPNPSNWSDTSITITIPSGITGGPITVNKQGIVSPAAAFTLLQSLSVLTVSPLEGPVGTPVTITGHGFGPTQSNSGISFNGQTATVQSWSDSQIIATVGSTSQSGPVYVGVAGLVQSGSSFTRTAFVTLTDSLGNRTTYKSILQGGLWLPQIVTGTGCSTCTERGNVSYTYDGNGEMLSRTDENGHTTTYTWDANFAVTSSAVPVDNAKSLTKNYTNNSLGEVLTAQDPLGNTTTNTYDANGNLLTVTTPPPAPGQAPSVTQFAYYPNGELEQITDPLNNTTTFTYKSVGLIQTITDAKGNVTTYDYNDQGDRKLVQDAQSHQTKFEYDLMHHLKTITYADNTTSTFIYDSRGRRISMTDQNNYTTRYGYDDADRLTTVTDANGGVTTYGYDTEGNLKTIRDALGRTTQFDYYARGWVKTTTFPSNLTESYQYDDVGNLKSKTDRNQQTIQYAYDYANRLKTKTYPNCAAVNYLYDDDSRLTQVTDPTGTYQFTFDNMGRLIGTSTQYAYLPGKTYTNTYGYDAASNRTSAAFSADGSSNAYTYDALNRLGTLTSSFSGQFTFQYDTLSRLQQIGRPNPVASNYSYDSLSRLLSVLHQTGTTTIDGSTYTYDAAGNRQTKLNSLNGITETYGYDNIYQLKSVVQGSTTTEQYTYDAVGNRLANLTNAIWNYDASNHLTNRPGLVYSYDNNGNTLTKTDGTGTVQYTWDFENRLVKVTNVDGSSVSHLYDPFGRRIYKSSSFSTAIYLYDGANIVTQLDQNAAVAATYAQGPGIDQPLATVQGGTLSFYEQDGLGSVTSLSNAAGALTGSNVYDAFGNTSQTGLATPFRYTGREFDSEDGLYYYRARYYDPGAGRFISEDPVRFGAGVSFYAYARNRPTNMTDPSGLWPIITLPDTWTAAEEAAYQAFVRELEAAGMSAGDAAAEALLMLTYVFDPSGGNNSEYARSRDYQYECGRGNRWQCRVRCALIDLRTGSAVGYVETVGFGPTEADAFQNGQHQLQNSTPRGFRTKHCHSVGCQKL